MPGLCATLLAPDKDRGLFVLFRIYKAFEPTQFFIKHALHWSVAVSENIEAKWKLKKSHDSLKYFPGPLPPSTAFSSPAPIYNQITIITIVIIIMRGIASWRRSKNSGIFSPEEGSAWSPGKEMHTTCNVFLLMVSFITNYSVCVRV